MRYKIQIQIFNCQISPGLAQPVDRATSTTGHAVIKFRLMMFCEHIYHFSQTQLSFAYQQWF